jgi:hypothetical protein
MPSGTVISNGKTTYNGTNNWAPFSSTSANYLKGTTISGDNKLNNLKKI